MNEPDNPGSARTLKLRWLLIAGLVVVAAGAVAALVLSGSPSKRAVSPPRNRSLAVDLSTPVDMAEGQANPSAVVLSGDARFEVLTPGVIRLEYSPSGHFENAPTVNVLDRRMPVPPYTTDVSSGWLTIHTSEATLRYKVGSGAFTPANTSVAFKDGAASATADPTWDWECTFDETCQAGAATVGGGAQIGQNQTGYDSDAGYVGDLIFKGARATWNVIGAPAGRANLSFRFSNLHNFFGPTGAHTLDLVVNGHPATKLTMPETTNTAPWSTFSTSVNLDAGTNTVEVLCAKADTCDVELDTLSVASFGSPLPRSPQTDPLGGWIRGFDTFTYQPGPPTCEPGTRGTACINTIEPLHQDGLLDRAGWRLLDDTQSALWTSHGWLQARPSDGDIEDGYLFVYGDDYIGALRTLAEMTGPAPLLPRDVFGVWYSDYTPYSSAYIEDKVYPGFVRNDVPLNTLSLDTDWKAPNSWDGWEWSKSLFPDPTSFLDWANSHGIDVTLNIHSSIADDDPKLASVEKMAGGNLASSSCTDDGPCKVWDWSSERQAESNFALQQALLNQGVSFWWLDWCCDNSVVSMPGVTPDSWIDHLYAQAMLNQGERGFVLARIGSSNGSPEQVYPAGAWSDHTSTIAFTGDAWGTWTQLAAEVSLTTDEATIGEPYVSDDIGSYLGPPPQVTQDPPDLYDRWVQFGTFQPILRLHSDAENRLPWEYPEPVSGITESFLRLREALVPYTYTLSEQAYSKATPIAQPLYLQYPSLSPAYSHPEEYLYGSDVLVAPVLAPGDSPSVTVWFPPGRWIDYFTGATFSGPATQTLSVPLDRMPVFVRAGGILPEEPSTNAETPLYDLKVYSGASGSFDLYDDSGTGLGYEHGQSTTTKIEYSQGSQSASVRIGGAIGHFPGESARVSYEIQIVDTTDPTNVTLNGHVLSTTTQGSTRPGWYYDLQTRTTVVLTGSQTEQDVLTVVANGERAVSLEEPS